MDWIFLPLDRKVSSVPGVSFPCKTWQISNITYTQSSYEVGVLIHDGHSYPFWGVRVPLDLEGGRLQIAGGDLQERAASGGIIPWALCLLFLRRLSQLWMWHHFSPLKEAILCGQRLPAPRQRYLPVEETSWNRFQECLNTTISLWLDTLERFVAPLN